MILLGLLIKEYHVLRGEIELESKNVTSWALFTNSEAKLWERSIEYINDATKYFSRWVGEYPYNHVTAVDGTIKRWRRDGIPKHYSHW